MKCDACGAPVEDGKCTYCGKNYTKNIEVNIQTPTPTYNTNTYVPPTEPKKKVTFGKVLLWIFFLPIMATIAIWKSNWKTVVKIIVTIILWGICIGYGATSESDAATITFASEGAKASCIEYQIDENMTYSELSLM